MNDLEKIFLPYCDHEYANREDNAANSAEEAVAFTIGFVKWFDFLTDDWYSQNDTMTSYSDIVNFYLREVYDSAI